MSLAVDQHYNLALLPFYGHHKMAAWVRNDSFFKVYKCFFFIQLTPKLTSVSMS